MTLLYEKFVMGDMGTNCYLLWEKKTKTGMVIDPADSGVELAQELDQKKIKLKAILATHGHFDHLLGGLDLKLIYSAPFYCHSADQYLLKRQNRTAKYFLKRKIEVPNFVKIDIDLAKLRKLTLGKEAIEIIPCPGHTPGSVCFYVESQGWLFSGDVPIENLPKLAKGTLVLPGHGEEFELGGIL
jgi:glyoxylase-like metal-dependent hydrolase (beta-lactamase superfamily II)